MRELQQRLRDPRTSIGDALGHDRFFALAQAWDDDAAAFIVAHFREIFDHAFQIAEPFQMSLSKCCLSLLSIPTDAFRAHLLSDTSLVALLKDYAGNLDRYPFRSHTAYFSLIEVFCFRGGAVAPAFDDDRFWVALFNRLDIDRVDRFIGDIFAAMRQAQQPNAAVMRRSVGAIFARINLAQILVRNFFHVRHVRKRRSQLLFLQAVALGLPLDARGALLRDAAVPRLLWLAKQERDAQTFEFFTRIAELGWSAFVREAAANLDSLCAFVQCDNAFGRCDFAVICFVAQIVRSAGRATDAYRSLIGRVTVLFFKLPRQTRVHNGLVALLSALASVERIRVDFVQELRLFPLITERMAARDSDVSSIYWAQIAEIARLIDPLARKAGVDVARWQAVVMAPIRERDAIVAATYGGELPQSIPVMEEEKEKSGVLPYVAGLAVVATVAVCAFVFLRGRVRV
jgi:hypothetical protein